mgnify:CR=1 FL=1|jgi:hypothetical protein
MTDPMYRFTSLRGVDRWGRSFLSGVVVALAVATLAMFVAIPVWKEVHSAGAATALEASKSPPPFHNEASVPIRGEVEVATSSSAVGI